MLYYNEGTVRMKERFKKIISQLIKSLNLNAIGTAVFYLRHKSNQAFKKRRHHGKQ